MPALYPSRRTVRSASSLPFVTPETTAAAMARPAPAPTWKAVLYEQNKRKSQYVEGEEGWPARTHLIIPPARDLASGGTLAIMLTETAL